LKGLLALAILRVQSSYLLELEVPLEHRMDVPDTL
jgi:hypothetical protein